MCCHICCYMYFWTCNSILPNLLPVIPPIKKIDVIICDPDIAIQIAGKPGKYSNHQYR